MKPLWLWPLVAAAICAQPPAILQEGVRNDASRIPPSLAGGAIAPGALVSIEGLRFPPDVQVRLRGTPIAVLRSDVKQIVARIPADAAIGPGTLTVHNADGPSRPFAIRIAPVPGIYSVNGLGWGPAAGAPALVVAGQPVSIRSTGFLAGSKLWLAGEQVEVAASPHGLLSFTIPSSASLGCHVPVHATGPTGLVSNFVTLAIARPGESRCAESAVWPKSAEALASPLTLALLARFVMKLKLPDGLEVDFTSDEAAVQAFEPTGTAPLALRALPPPGACTNFTGLYVPSFQPRTSLLDLLRGHLQTPLTPTPGPTAFNGRPLDEVPADSGRGFFARLGGERPDVYSPPRPLVLSPGRYSLAVGEHQAIVEMPSARAWKSFDTMAKVDRRRPLRFDWTRTSDSVYLVLASVQHSTTAFGVCVCTMPSGATSFAVPAAYFSNLPPSEPDATTPVHLVMLITAPGRAVPALSGDAGWVVPFTVTGRTVEFR